MGQRIQLVRRNNNFFTAGDKNIFSEEMFHSEKDPCKNMQFSS
jgi:hypothetical protein